MAGPFDVSEHHPPRYHFFNMRLSQKAERQRLPIWLMARKISMGQYNLWSPVAKG
jgi:hypothetical protein